MQNHKKLSIRTLAHLHEEPSISRRKQKRRITSYLSNISKQVERHRNQINKMTLMIQSRKQKQNKPTLNARIDRSQSESIKQIKSQINQLHRQIAQIQNDVQVQNDVQRIRTVSITEKRQGSRTKVRKRAPSTIVKPRPKRTKSYRSIQSGKLKRTARNRLKKSKS